jgi:hypothetical protein
MLSDFSGVVWIGPSSTVKTGTQSGGLAAIAGAAAPTAMTGTAQAAPLATVRRLGRRTSIPCERVMTHLMFDAALSC